MIDTILILFEDLFVALLSRLSKGKGGIFKNTKKFERPNFESYQTSLVSEQAFPAALAVLVCVLDNSIQPPSRKRIAYVHR